MKGSPFSLLSKLNRQALIDSAREEGDYSRQLETVRRLREKGMTDSFIQKIVDIPIEEWENV